MQERPEKWSLPPPLLFKDKHCLLLPFRDQHHRQATCWRAKSPQEKKSKMELEITPQRDCLLPGLLLTVNLRAVPEPRINPTRKAGLNHSDCVDPGVLCLGDFYPLLSLNSVRRTQTRSSDPSPKHCSTEEPIAQGNVNSGTKLISHLRSSTTT